MQQLNPHSQQLWGFFNIYLTNVWWELWACTKACPKRISDRWGDLFRCAAPC